MGGKLSSDSTSTRGRTFADHAGPSEPSNGIRGSTQGGAMTAGSLPVHRRPMMRFDPSLLAEGGPTRLDPRLSRANSESDARLRIPRSGFGLFYRLQEEREEETAGSSRGFGRTRHSLPHSLPPYFLGSMRDAKCPMCGKMIPAEDVEVHFVMCLTKPRVTYNEDTLSTTMGECPICFDDLEEGSTIARLPCLCVYHKGCIDEWFKKSQTCPEHPPD
uniref:RING-type E3 ubiquitin transferase n=1 Tax=Ciona savignyi TaxID=51511 RepID=H2ZPM5_CIOSA